VILLKLKGAQLILQCLKEQGVDTVFGYPGGAVIPLYDALYDEKEIVHVITAHEQGASHAADGYARATGKVGVVFATSGPGATNTVTGIATAFSDSIPMVVITGQVARPLLGRDSFQEVDITSITASITKKNYQVKSVEELPGTIEEAFYIAKDGRPGPVLIDIPKDVQLCTMEYNSEEKLQSMAACAADKKYAEGPSLEEAIKLINECKRPMIYAGGGIITAGASGTLMDFAEKIKAPVTTSLMGAGGFPYNHPLFTGMVGMHGSHSSNYGITHCDLLITLGARFSDRVASHIDSFAPDAKVIHIDIDASEIGKNVRVDVPIVGDLSEILPQIFEAVQEKKLSEWNEKINNWKEEYPLKDDHKGLSPQYILSKLFQLSEGKVVITTEVGQNQMWAAQYFTYTEPRSFISSGGLGTMGYGLGAAIGASFGNTGKKIVNVAGDGSFKMNSTELVTLARYKCPVVQLVFNNHALGMVRQWQEMFCNGRLSFTQLGEDVDFVKLGAAYGIKGIRVEKEDQVEEALRYALSLDEPIIVNCIINEENKVLPMVAPGAPIHEIIYK
jgi:acetolactate synthase-1/2/3 large subunit